MENVELDKSDINDVLMMIRDIIKGKDLKKMFINGTGYYVKQKQNTNYFCTKETMFQVLDSLENKQKSLISISQKQDFSALNKHLEDIEKKLDEINNKKESDYLDDFDHIRKSLQQLNTSITSSNQFLQEDFDALKKLMRETRDNSEKAAQGIDTINSSIKSIPSQVNGIVQKQLAEFTVPEKQAEIKQETPTLQVSTDDKNKELLKQMIDMRNKLNEHIEQIVLASMMDDHTVKENTVEEVKEEDAIQDTIVIKDLKDQE